MDNPQSKSYYKLNELSGLTTAVYGLKFPMSLIAKFAIEDYYFKNIQNLRDLIQNPDKAEEARNVYLKEHVRRSKMFMDVLE